MTDPNGTGHVAAVVDRPIDTQYSDMQFGGTQFSDAHAVWHAEVEAARTAPFGPLAATGMHWLTTERQELPGLPGNWTATPDGLVTVQLREDDGVQQAGQPVAGEVVLGPLRGSDSVALTWGETHIEVAARSGGVIVRPRNPASPLRLAYAGTPVFAPHRDWVVEAEFEADPRARVEVPSAAGAGLIQHLDSPGRAVFTLGGERQSLTLFGSWDQGSLRAIFSDTDPGTFSRARFVDVEARSTGLVLDFNRTANPPCAYTAHATCPLPPPENQLSVAIPAGEALPGE